MPIKVSTPSRICLFGEHQDYLQLEVVAAAINLRFSAIVEDREDSVIDIKIRDEKFSKLGEENPENLYQEYQIDLTKPIVYENNRDYLKVVFIFSKKKGMNSHMDLILPWILQFRLEKECVLLAR